MDSKISAPVQFDWKDEDLTVSTVSDLTYSLGTDTITLTDTLNNMSLSSPYTVTGSIGTGLHANVTGINGINFPNTIYTTAGATTTPWMQHNPTGAKIQLDGDSADITVNGWSLVAAVKRIEERLGLFQPNPELEAEWEDLQALGEQYRRLEQHIKDKQATWDKLKAMPAPEVD